MENVSLDLSNNVHTAHMLKVQQYVQNVILRPSPTLFLECYFLLFCSVKGQAYLEFKSNNTASRITL